jgi:hypothetical protein
VAQLHRVAALLALTAAGVGCRWWERRHPRARRAPSRSVATHCYDPRFVTGQRVAGHFVGDHPAVAGTAGARVFAWRTAGGVSAWWEGMTAPAPVVDHPVADGPTVAVRRGVAYVGWSDAAGSAVRSLSMDGSLGAPAQWAGAANATVCVAGDYALWVARLQADGSLAARGLDGGEARVFTQGGAGPAAAALPDGYMVAWTQADGAESVLRARTLGLDGRARGPVLDLQRAPGVMGAPSVALGGDRLLFAWGDHRSGDAGLHVISTDLAGAGAGPAQRLSIRYTDDSVASVAGAGRSFGVAWSEPVGGGAPRSYLARVDGRGRRLGSAMRVAVEDDSAMTRPALRWERAGFVMAMERADGALELRRTGPLGCDAPLD